MNQEKNPAKVVSIMCFHDEMCLVFNALMTAQSLLRAGSKVTIFFGSRGINAVHKDKIDKLVCLPDQPQEARDNVVKNDGGNGASGVFRISRSTGYMGPVDGKVRQQSGGSPG